MLLPIHLEFERGCERACGSHGVLWDLEKGVAGARLVEGQRGARDEALHYPFVSLHYHATGAGGGLRYISSPSHAIEYIRKRY